MTTVVLVQMPFLWIGRPAISLSLLRGVLEEDGHETEIRYLNIEYARRIGLDLYQVISEQMSNNSQFTEMIFSGMWAARPGGMPESDVWQESQRHLEETHVPGWLIRALPDVAAEASRMVCEESLAIARGDFDLAGFNTTFNLMPSLAMAAGLKRSGARARVVLGGASVEAKMGEAVMRLFPAVDYVCPGEGERALLNLVRHLEAGEDSGSRVPGMLTRSWPNATTPERWQDLNALPVPRYDDWVSQLDSSGIELAENLKLIPIETSRGCWYGAQQHCTFCGLNGESLAFRSKDPEHVIRDIDAALSYGIRNVHAVDNILDLRYFKTVLPVLAENRRPVRIFYEVKSKMTREQAELMSRAGIQMIQPGIESFSTPVLKLMRKGVEAYHNIRLLRWCEELDIIPGWNLLYGFPREDRQDFLEMFELIPLVHHFRPPSVSRVRLDRFSPLYFDGTALGVGRKWVPASYKHIYGLPESALEDLVYYFDFAPEDGNQPEEYGKILKGLAAEWEALYPSSALLRVEREDGCWVYDTRAVAKTARERLDAAELEVLRRADRGIRRRELEEAADRRILAAISKLIHEGWLLPIDNRLLSLVVDYTPVIPASMPAELLEAFCLELASIRHRVASAPDNEQLTLRAMQKAASLRRTSQPEPTIV